MNLFEQLDRMDACSTTFLAGVLIFAGQILVRHDSILQDRGIRVGVAGFLLWLAIAWGRGSASSGSELFAATIRGLLVGALTSLITWVVISFWVALRSSVLDPCLQQFASWEADARRRSDEESQRRQSADAEREAAERWAREAPERERQRVEAAEKQRHEHEARLANQRRRDDARSRSELLFTTFAPEIGERFTRSMLDSFVRTYMGDDRRAEEVEARARELEAILKEHRLAICPLPQFRNVEDVTIWYLAEKGRIESLPIDGLFKEQQLVLLAMRYSDLTQKLLEQP